MKKDDIGTNYLTDMVMGKVPVNPSELENRTIPVMEREEPSILTSYEELGGPG